MSSVASRSSAAGYGQGVRAAVAVAATVWFFGASFGLVARAAGMGVAAPLVLSATTFAGSAQFALTSILADSGGAVAAIAAAVLLNARYAPISISVASLFHGRRLRRLAESQLIVDESWALSSRGDGRFDRRLLIGAGLLLYAAWLSGTAVGVFAGKALGDPKALGLDGAFPALFLALLVPQLRTRTATVAALLGGAIALVLIPLAPPGVPIVVASAACLLGLRRGEDDG
ncbi:MAG TPA: AzlC family ABC transporter permease [Gaiellaceae bacterium]|nr:AzlC family ABC transporter permease [Gaiellaceae bacterium]